MSPLVCMTVAALFAAANATPSPSCNRVELGYPSDDTVRINLKGIPSGVINFPDNCSKSGKELGGSAVTVCSKGGSTAPYITVLGNSLTSVMVSCPEDAGGCPIVDLLVLEKCYVKQNGAVGSGL